jgi:hypothetical protein
VFLCYLKLNALFLKALSIEAFFSTLTMLYQEPLMSSRYYKELELKKHQHISSLKYQLAGQVILTMHG